MVHTAITGTCDTITITVEVSDIAISERILSHDHDKQQVQVWLNNKTVT